MHLSEEHRAYLTGQQHTSSLRLPFAWEEEDRQYLSRIDVLAGLCRGKKVIHLGCVDHSIAMVESKLRHNRWLHKVLCESAGRCYGVDIHEEGIRYIREVLGYQDAEAIDLTTADSREISENGWDYLLVPEVLEHADNPVQFLSALRGKCKSNVKHMVITVPNAFARGNFRKSKKGLERINSDHRYWFTPYTLSKVCTSAGLEVEKIVMCRQGYIKKHNVLANHYLRRHPLQRDTILMILGMGGPG